MEESLSTNKPLIQSLLPEASHDSSKLVRPESDETDFAIIAPIQAPQLEAELVENDDDLSDVESILSDIDEAQFEDFDPATIAIEQRPVAVDESNVALIGTHKRKATEEGEGAGRKKKREGRREKPKKSRKPRDDDENFSGGEELEGKRVRKKKDIIDKKDRPATKRPSPENEEELTPEESTIVAAKMEKYCK